MSIIKNSSSTPLPKDIDPLLKDLSEKKQSFRRNVVSLAEELKDVRSRLASQEQSFAHETLTRQASESKAKDMEEKIFKLQKSLEERNEQLQASASDAEKRDWFKKFVTVESKYPRKLSSIKLKYFASGVLLDIEHFSLQSMIACQSVRVQYCQGLDDLRSQLSATQATVDASVVSAQSAELQCLVMLKELGEKNIPLKEQEICVNRLGEQLDRLERDLKAREFSEKQLKDEVLRVEHDIMQVVVKAASTKDYELRKILEEVSSKSFEKINKLLSAKDEEIEKLRDELTVISAHWKLKTNDMESQLEKQRIADQELQKRVLKLEFCLQEARAQTRKLQRGPLVLPSVLWVDVFTTSAHVAEDVMGERREKALKELRDELATMNREAGSSARVEKHSFWESSGFMVLISMSMLILVLFSKR
ncbi:hypothetical protein LguiA_008295 [Lonicera macranthoides]